MNQQLSFTKTIIINAPVALVWDALVNPAIIKEYLFGTNTITDWKEGGPIKFVGSWEGKEYTDKGTVMQCRPEEILQYTYWSSMSGTPDVADNYSTVTFELFERGEKTELRLTQQNFKDQVSCDHSADNWTSVLKTMATLVEGKQTR